MKPRTTHWCLYFIPAVLLLVAQTGRAQIPNAGFENWATDPDSNYNPAGWQTSNSFPLVNVEPYSPSCQGNYAMRVRTLNPGFPFPGVAFLQVAYNFSQMPTRFSACVKSNIMPGDHAYIIVGLMRGDSVIALQDSCTFHIDSTISQFTYRVFPLTIQSNLIPDSLIIIVASGLGTGQVGTELVVDDLAFGAPTDVREIESPRTFVLKQNYPNPFNPSTNIAFQIPSAGFVSLKVYNLLGQEVATLVNEELQPGSYKSRFDGSALMSGTYFYTLRTSQYSDTKKFILMK